jgi:PAS domain S-box-containing protein
MSSTDSLVGSLPLPFLLRALDRLVESVIITDADGAICFWNDGASALYGFTSAEAMGRQLDRLILAPGRRGHVDADGRR